MQKLNYKLIGYDCPLGCYPAPLTPIVSDGNGEYKAVYLNDNLEPVTELVSRESVFSKLSDSEKIKFEEFDYRKHRLFAVSKNDIRLYQATKQSYFFYGLLADKNFSYDDPFVRISLAEDVGDPDLVRDEVESCERYLKRHARELLPFLEEERARLKEIKFPRLAIKRIKPRLKNLQLLEKRLNPPKGMDLVIFSSNCA